MTQLPNVGGLPLPGDGDRRQVDAINNLELDHFLDLMIAELQNQDPLNPLDNSQMLQQISQIREVGATDRLTETLDTLLLRQNVASATSLIGQHVEGRTDAGSAARGIVQRVSIIDGTPQLFVDGQTVAQPAGSEDGSIEAGTYRYRVVFEASNDLGGTSRYHVDVGPVETTGTPGRDRGILLRNLPVTDGPKAIYRTKAGGDGDYHLVAELDDGGQESFLDTTADDLLSGTLTGTSLPHAGGRSTVVKLNNITQIRLPDRAGEEDDF